MSSARQPLSKESADTPANRARLVAVGTLGRPHGTRGEIRLDHKGTLPRGLHGYGRFFTKAAGGGFEEIEIAGWRHGGEFLFLSIAGMDDRDQVRAYTGRTLYVPREDLPPLADDEYYHADLIGARVLDEAGDEVAVVEDVKPWGAYDMLVLRTGRKTWMLPVVDQYVLEINGTEKRVVVRVPEGLGP